MTENELIVALQKGGDPSLFEKLDRRYRPRLRSFLVVRGYCPEQDADDRVQQTLLRAFCRIADLRSPDDFLPWLFQIGRRVCIDQGRKRSPRPFSDWEEDETGESPEIRNASYRVERTGFQKAEERRNLWTTARELLPPEDFRILWLRYAEKWTDEEIGKSIRKRPGTVRVILHRIRKKLAQRMNEGGTEE